MIPVVTTEREAEFIAREDDLPWLHQQCVSVGRPRYFGHEDETWSVSIEVPTGRPGCTASVASGYGHATLTDAMRAALLKVRGGEE